MLKCEQFLVSARSDDRAYSNEYVTEERHRRKRKGPQVSLREHFNRLLAPPALLPPFVSFVQGSSATRINCAGAFSCELNVRMTSVEPRFVTVSTAVQCSRSSDVSIL